MKKIVILISLVLIFFLVKYFYTSKNKCIESNTENNYKFLEEWKFNKICNYKNIFNELWYDLNSIYLLSKSDKNFALEKIKEYLKKEIDNVEKFQIYFILNKVYWYNWEKIKNNFNLNFSRYIKINKENNIEQILLAENLLTKEFNWNNYLKSKEISLLKIIFELEPKRFNSINLIANLKDWYNSIKNKQDKKEFLEIMKKLSNNLENKESKKIISNFLNNIK